MDTKVCTKCKVEKPLSDFWRHHITKDGYAYRCKSCIEREKKQRLARKKLHERAEMLMAFRTLKRDIKRVAGKE